MKKIKFISGIILSSGFLLNGISSIQAASDNFGRLFTTPEERKKLQVLRYSEPEVKAAIEIFVDEPIEEKIESEDIQRIKLNGLVYRKGSKSTVWLNGSNSYEGSFTTEYFRINAGDINGEKVSVTVPDAKLKFDLKVGQTFEPNDGSLIDIIENGDDIEILRN